MKRLIFLILMIAIVVVSCNKEDALEPSANFTTNIENNTLMAGEGFTIYLDDVQGEFLVYFRGHNLESTYDASDPTRTGTIIPTDADSLQITGYPVNILNDTTFVFTVVASSSGNWAEDYLQDVKSIDINVLAPQER